MLFIDETIRQSHSPDSQQVPNARRDRPPDSQKDHEGRVEAHSEEANSHDGRPDPRRRWKLEGLETRVVKEGERDGEDDEGEEADEGGEEGGMKSEGEGGRWKSWEGEVFLVDNLQEEKEGGKRGG